MAKIFPTTAFCIFLISGLSCSVSRDIFRGRSSESTTPFFVDEDLKLGLRIREIEIKLEVAQARYKELFEGEAQ